MPRFMPSRVLFGAFPNLKRAFAPGCGHGHHARAGDGAGVKPSSVRQGLSTQSMSLRWRKAVTLGRRTRLVRSRLLGGELALSALSATGKRRAFLMRRGCLKPRAVSDPSQRLCQRLASGWCVLSPGP